MLTALQRLGRSISTNIRLQRRQSEQPDTDNNNNNDSTLTNNCYDAPRIRITSKPRRFGWGITPSSTNTIEGNVVADDNDIQGDSNNNSTKTEHNDQDNEIALPLLYSLARSWAWEAITFRCTTHPHEVDSKYRDHRGDTCLHWVSFGRPPLTTIQIMLRTCPALAETTNYYGTLPLHVACSYRASSDVIKEILLAYPKAAMIPDANGSTPLHHLCDYGGSNGSDQITSMKVLLHCFGQSFGIQSTMMTDYRYHRRPLFILNARKNIYDQEQNFDTIRNRRFRQRAIRNESNNETTWNQQLKDELLDRLEDDISNISHNMMFSLLIVAEYKYMLFINSIDSTSMQYNQNMLDQFFDITDGSNSNDVIEIEGSKYPSEKISLRKREVDSIILHAYVNNLDCPTSLLEYAILLYEPHLLVSNPLIVSDYSNRVELPLHTVASMYNKVIHTSGTTDRVSHLLLLLLEGCPTAASVRDNIDNGKLPLSLILQQDQPSSTQLTPGEGKTHIVDCVENNDVLPVHWSNGLHKLINTYPLALLETNLLENGHRKKLPHILSRIGTNRNTLFTILQADPTLLTTATTSI